MLNKILALHDPNAIAADHVYSVWEDGEITVEKGGDLYGLRRLHMLAPGAGRILVPVESMPMKNITRTHGFLTTTSYDVARSARDLMLQLADGGIIKAKPGTTIYLDVE